MNTLIIPVHSVVDLITNSSSEIFVAADSKTVSTIKKLVTNIISASGGTLTADDLFNFELVYKCVDDKYDEIEMTASEMKIKKKEISNILDNELSSAEDIEKAEEWRFGDENDDGYESSAVRVTVKDKTNKNAVAASKILSDLTSIFSIESRYC